MHASAYPRRCFTGMRCLSISWHVAVGAPPLLCASRWLHRHGRQDICCLHTSAAVHRRLPSSLYSMLHAYACEGQQRKASNRASNLASNLLSNLLSHHSFGPERPCGACWPGVKPCARELMAKKGFDSVAPDDLFNSRTKLSLEGSSSYLLAPARGLHWLLCPPTTRCGLLCCNTCTYVFVLENGRCCDAGGLAVVALDALQHLGALSGALKEVLPLF
mmetsp:Transcript_84995/g.124354  ORF Transcript_84995/g.124354 Transcript_84995/m.124354 type:complete len:218 (+) Transcript_84995:332-985(+)